MGTGVARAASARSLEFCGRGSGSSSRFWNFLQQRSAGRAQRRAFALSASIEDVLIAVAGRASDRLKHERPKFSAATLKKPACCIPLLVGIGALLALRSPMSTIALCVLAVLPAAFRILVFVSRTPRRSSARSTRSCAPTRSCSRAAGSSHCCTWWWTRKRIR